MENIVDEAFKKERVLIGAGKMAKVYLWNGFAYKCFGEDYPEDWIAYEIQIQNTINQSGLPTVKYYPSTIPHSIKMDYIEGLELTNRLRKEKYKNGLEDLFSVFMKVHEITSLELPRLNPFLLQRIEQLDLDQAQKELAIQYLSEIADGDVLCHLDFHYSNLLYANDEYYIIDWVNAKIGNPIYDFARTYVIMYEFVYRHSKKYLSMVNKYCDFDSSVLQKAIYVMAVHRLTEFNSEKSRELIAQHWKIQEEKGKVIGESNLQI